MRTKSQHFIVDTDWNSPFYVCVFSLRMCVLGKRLLKDIDPANCTKDIDGPLHKLYCNGTSTHCEDYYNCKCKTISNHDLSVRLKSIFSIYSIVIL